MRTKDSPEYAGPALRTIGLQMQYGHGAGVVARA